MDVVVAVAVSSAAEPAVLDFLGVQGSEGVDEAAAVSELPVEAIFEWREELVAGLVVGFENVEIA